MNAIDETSRGIAAKQCRRKPRHPWSPILQKATANGQLLEVVAEGNKDQEVADPNELAYLTLSIYRRRLPNAHRDQRYKKRVGRPEQGHALKHAPTPPTGVLGGTSGCRGNRENQTQKILKRIIRAEALNSSFDSLRRVLGKNKTERFPPWYQELSQKHGKDLRSEPNHRHANRTQQEAFWAHGTPFTVPSQNWLGYHGTSVGDTILRDELPQTNLRNAEGARIMSHCNKKLPHQIPLIHVSRPTICDQASMYGASLPRNISVRSTPRILQIHFRLRGQSSGRRYSSYQRSHLWSPS
jgi:hypothetical protein